jgi:hypothetical protein
MITVLTIWILQTILGAIIIKKRIDRETPIWMALLISSFVFFNIVAFIYWVGLRAEKLLRL